jgi:hypothetical protein
MKGLTTGQVSRACQIYMNLAYPDGESSVPPAKHGFLNISPEQKLEELLVPPHCQTLTGMGGRFRGYSLRLGSASYPHLKLKMELPDKGAGHHWVFGVDTHDDWCLDPCHPDAPALQRLKKLNQQLKEKIERAWEEAGVLTFNGLLREALKQPSGVGRGVS